MQGNAEQDVLGGPFFALLFQRPLSQSKGPLKLANFTRTTGMPDTEHCTCRALGWVRSSGFQDRDSQGPIKGVQQEPGAGGTNLRQYTMRFEGRSTS